MSLKNPTDRELHLQEEFNALCHAMQSGVAADQGSGSQDGSPKHLRTGVNVALVQQAALISLLEDRGIITAEEYWEASVKQMALEVTKYEALLGERHGTKITLA